MQFAVQTKGHYDFVDITPQVEEMVSGSGIENGAALVFAVGSTVAITTMEFEEGIQADIKSVLEKIAPENYAWQHHQRWGDKNGAAHIKSALIGTDLTVPVEKGHLALGAWQQIVLIDFDERPRTRRVIVKVWQTDK